MLFFYHRQSVQFLSEYLFPCVWNTYNILITVMEILLKVALNTITLSLLFFSVDGKLMQAHLAGIRHARWVEENACHSR